jgi:hypothetical protein
VSTAFAAFAAVPPANSWTRPMPESRPPDRSQVSHSLDSVPIYGVEHGAGEMPWQPGLPLAAPPFLLA